MSKKNLYPEQILNQGEDSRREISHIFDAFNGWTPKTEGFICDYVQTFQSKLQNFPYTEVNYS